MNRLWALPVLFCLPLVSCASAPRGELEVKVVKASGGSISGAEVWVGGIKGNQQTLRGTRKRGLTDKNGEIKLYGELRDIVYGVNVDKEGYYRSRKEVPAGNDEVGYDTRTVVTLREKKMPLSMYAKHEKVSLPSRDKRYGYDFSQGDIVDLSGKGNRPDVYLHVTRPIFKGILGPYKEILTISFPAKTDGIKFFKPPETAKHSEFKSHYQAPETGYTSEAVVKVFYKNGHDQKNWERPAYLRIRSKIDEEGHIENAHYCKIFPGFKTTGLDREKPRVEFTYYCNPEPNKRGMEFDYERSLVPGIEDEGWPRKPDVLYD